MKDCIFTFAGPPQLVDLVVKEISKLDGSDKEYWDTVRGELPRGRESVEVQALDMITLKRCLAFIRDFATSVDAELNA